VHAAQVEAKGNALGWIFNRTPREPSGNDDRANELPKRTKTWRGEGWSVGNRPARRAAGHPEGWGGAGEETERSGGDDWTRRRPDRW
jgi:hypothetical protein